MSESKTPMERLDLLLAGLEDEVLRSESEKNFSPEHLVSMRSEIESLIRANADRAQEWESGQSAGVPTATAGAKEIMARAMKRLGSLAGASPRVRMAFSGARPEKARKSKGGNVGTGDDVPDDERR